MVIRNKIAARGVRSPFFCYSLCFFFAALAWPLRGAAYLPERVDASVVGLVDPGVLRQLPSLKTGTTKDQATPWFSLAAPVDPERRCSASAVNSCWLPLTTPPLSHAQALLRPRLGAVRILSPRGQKVPLSVQDEKIQVTVKARSGEGWVSLGSAVDASKTCNPLRVNDCLLPLTTPTTGVASPRPPLNAKKKRGAQRIQTVGTDALHTLQPLYKSEDPVFVRNTPDMAISVRSPQAMSSPMPGTATVASPSSPAAPSASMGNIERIPMRY